MAGFSGGRGGTHRQPVMCVTVGPAQEHPSLPSDQVLLVSIGKAGAQSTGQSEGMNQVVSTMLSPDSSHKAHWTGSGMLYAHSDPGILCL